MDARKVSETRGREGRRKNEEAAAKTNNTREETEDQWQ